MKFWSWVHLAVFGACIHQHRRSERRHSTMSVKYVCAHKARALTDFRRSRQLAGKYTTLSARKAKTILIRRDSVADSPCNFTTVYNRPRLEAGFKLRFTFI